MIANKLILTFRRGDPRTCRYREWKHTCDNQLDKTYRPHDTNGRARVGRVISVLGNQDVNPSHISNTTGDHLNMIGSFRLPGWALVKPRNRPSALLQPEYKPSTAAEAYFCGDKMPITRSTTFAGKSLVVAPFSAMAEAKKL